MCETLDNTFNGFTLPVGGDVRFHGEKGKGGVHP